MPKTCLRCEGKGIVTRVDVKNARTLREKCPDCKGKKIMLTDDERQGITVSIVKCQTVFLQKLIDGKYVATLELRVMPLLIDDKPAINGQDQMLFDCEIPRMVTEPAHRGKGYMAALLHVAQECAFAPGVVARMRTNLSDSTEQGRSFLRHHGFKERGDQLVWERGLV